MFASLTSSDPKLLIKLNINTRLNSFLKLGKRFKNLPDDETERLFEQAEHQNPWFTKDNIRLAFEGLLNYLEEEKMNRWVADYDFSVIQPKTVGVVMAGNIPMAGIHDMICVLLSGHNLKAKLSNQDEVLIRFIADELMKIEPDFAQKIEFAEVLSNIDAVIATGSDNTSRYFDYYFSKYPHIIRKNRTSIAVLTGDESADDLKALGHDIFSYFGLGCRNVSKLYVPKGYEINSLFEHFKDYDTLIDHYKYHNNYYYQKSILLVNQTEHKDTGFAIFIETDKLVSPVSMIYYEFYDDLNDLRNELILISDKIQCIVSNENFFGKNVKFGTAQKPEPWDYADDIDTIKFLTELR